MTGRHRSDGFEEIERDAFKVSRAAADIEAIKTGGAPKLGRRLVRRKITKSLLRRIWGR